MQGRLGERRELALLAYQDNFRAAETLGPERFAAGLASRTRRLDQATLALAAAGARKSPERLSGHELRERWPSITIKER